MAPSDALDSAIRAALSEGRTDDAVTIAVRGLGPEILGFLVATERDEADGDEIFGQFCEDLWKGIRGFRGESSFRTWAYALARNAAHRFRRDPLRRRGVGLSACTAISRLEAEVRTSTITYLRSEIREKVARLRQGLDPDDQMLLILRVDKQMGWAEIAEVFEGPGPTADARKKKAAALRKRFERVKELLREMARKEALSPERGGGSARSA